MLGHAFQSVDAVASERRGQPAFAPRGREDRRNRVWYTPGNGALRSGVIRELNVILDVVVASGEWRRLGRRRLTRFGMSPEG